MTIIGVAPRGFSGTTLGTHPYVFVPITMRVAMMPGTDPMAKRNAYWVYLFATIEAGRHQRACPSAGEHVCTTA